MRHRGPDDAGEWWTPDGRVGFGHRRLAIVDLSSAGHQPMSDVRGTLCIVFNGEIYNFQELRNELLSIGHNFVSGSDTEVVLAAYREWGTDCLARLNGMFAFALYDSEQQQLFLARDRAGEKPLFYTLAQGAIRFGSELKALFADSSLARRIDRQSLDCYLADGYVSGEQCILEGIRKLPPAHALVFEVSSGRSRVWRYWQVPQVSAAKSPAAFSEVDLLDELDVLLADAVRRQLVADVPVGILLSGGVDSSLITAMAVRARPAVKTFTMRLPGHGKYDETEHARLIARHFGTEHVEVEAEAANVTMLPMLARHFDEPMNDSSMVPTYLLSRLVRQHCTVALGGDGGDELFGGYPHYDRLLRMQRMVAGIPRMMRVVSARLAAKLLPVGFRGRNWLQGLSADMRFGVPLVAQMFDRTTRATLLTEQARCPDVAEGFRDRRISELGDLLQRSTRLDFETYLAEDILVKVDRASMLNSLEVRAPILDVRVIEFAFGKVPSNLKATVSSRKILLKKLAARLLPPSFDQHRKQGFSIPLSSWLQAGRWREYFREVLLDDGQAWFDHRIIEGMLTGERMGRSNADRLFGLVMFELWRREYQVEMGS